MKRLPIPFIFSLLLSLHAFTQVNLQPPTNLQSVLNGNDVLLNWNAPDTTNSLFLSWDNGITGGAIGLPDTGTYAVASRWDAAFLENYSEYTITKIAFYLPGSTAQINAKIWQGPNADSTVFTENNIPGNPLDWSYVNLVNPIPVISLVDLWVGYEVIQNEPDFPAGTDFGPAVAGFGDMININGNWVSMAQEYDLQRNFNVRVYLADASGDEIVLSPNKTPSQFNYTNISKPDFTSIKIQGDDVTDNVQSNLIGYHVYRNDQLITPAPIIDTFLLDPTLELGFYTYGVSAVYQEGESQPLYTTVQLGNPDIVIVPESIEKTVVIGSVEEEIMTIFNEGNIDLHWSAVPEDFFLFLNPPSGIVAPGEGVDVQLFIFTSGIVAGTYESNILFYQNNPDNPVDTVPVTITAVGSPGISVIPASVSFGDVSFGSSPFFVLNIWNTGTETLEISEIVSSSSLFSFDEIPNSIPPSGQDQLIIQFDASVLGEVSETLTIFSNDETQPQLDVPMTAVVSLQAPILLQSEVIDDDVTLTWDLPTSGEGTWLQWDDGTNFTSVGYTDGGTFQYAARWEPDQLAGFAGSNVTRVSFFPRGANSTYTLKIWKGENASIPVVSQAISTFQVDQWNEVFVQNPFQLDFTDELWVGFEVTQPAGDFPAGMDDGPAVSLYGDMLNVGGSWESTSFLYGLDNNWNIQVFLQQGDSSYKLASAPATKEPVKEFYNIGEISYGDLAPAIAPEFQSFDFVSDVLGYNVYRNDSLLTQDLLVEKTFTDENLLFGAYDYGVTAVYPEGESPQTNLLVQVGAPELVISPELISDTLEGGELKEYTLLLSNEGNFILNWNAAPGSFWLTLSQLSGSIEPGEQMEVTAILTSAGLFVGSYQANILFEVNNLNNPVISFPVQMVVTGEGMLSITPESIDFGMTSIGTTKTAYLSLTNSGNDVIYLNEVIASPDIFTTELFPFYLFPGGMVTFPVFFTPETAGVFSGEVTVTTGDSITQNQMTYTVPLEGNSLLPQPLSFTGVADSNNAVLDWLSPIGGMGDFLQYSAENSATAIGYGDGGTFLAAAKFSSEELMAFNGGEISQIGFIPWTDNAEFTVKLWVGENAEELIASKEVSNLMPLDWNDVLLDFPVPVDTANTLWIGYEVTHVAGEFPAGVDFGPAVENKGNLLSEDGTNWVSLSFYGLDFNWNIRGTVSQGEKSAAVLTKTPALQNTFTNNSFLKAAFLPGVQVPYKAGTNALELSGYNVYRNGEQINGSTLVTESEYIDEALESGLYSYEITAVYDLGESLPSGPVEILIESGANAPEGWEHHQTAMTHIVHIPTDVAEAGFMSPGDWVGVFYEDNGIMKSGGSLEWSSSDSLKLIVYGDDPATGNKEGFSLGEWMNWKVYMSESGQEFDVQVVYNPFMPNWDGNFNMLGESALNSIEVLTTGFNDNQDASVLLYPNPATGQFTIEGVRDYSKITIVTAMGMPISEHYISSQNIVRLTPGLSSGLYYVIIKSDSSRVIKKLLFR